MSTPTMTGSSRPFADAMRLLGSGVPLSLLLDLAMGPHSRELLDVERSPAHIVPGPRRPPGDLR